MDACPGAALELAAKLHPWGKFLVVADSNGHGSTGRAEDGDVVRVGVDSCDDEE